MDAVHLQSSPFPNSSRVVECGLAGLRTPGKLTQCSSIANGLNVRIVAACFGYLSVRTWADSASSKPVGDMTLSAHCCP